MWGLREHQWPKYMSDVYRILKPGNGWAQFGELDLSRWDNNDVPPDSYYAKVLYLFWLTYGANLSFAT